MQLFIYGTLVRFLGSEKIIMKTFLVLIEFKWYLINGIGQQMPFQCSNRLLVDKASPNAPNIEGVNANISYSVPDEVPFSIDHFSGKIVTKTSLDFETNQVFYVPVTAKDGGVVPRSASATATIFVQESVVKMNAIDFN